MALDSDVKRFLGIWAGAAGKHCPKISNNKCVTYQGTNSVVYRFTEFYHFTPTFLVRDTTITYAF